MNVSDFYKCITRTKRIDKISNVLGIILDEMSF